MATLTALSASIAADLEQVAQVADSREIFDHLQSLLDAARGKFDSRTVEEELVRCVFAGDTEAVGSLLKQRVNPDCLDVHGETLDRNKGAPLIVVAARQGHDAVIKQLVDARANVNLEKPGGATAAYIAAQEDNVNALSVLVEAGADINQPTQDGSTPASIAAAKDSVNALRVLVEAGADINQPTQRGSTPAYIAAQKDSANALRVLADAGADINQPTKDGATPAHAAARNDSANALRVLVEAGADINQPMQGGYTPAYIAAQKDNANALRVLVAAGADINQPNQNGATPAYGAAYEDSANALRVLVEAGADINQPTQGGSTPAYIAAERYNVNALRVLVEAGADLDQAVHGYTPLRLAQHFKHTNSISLLTDPAAYIEQHRDTLAASIELALNELRTITTAGQESDLSTVLVQTGNDAAQVEINSCTLVADCLGCCLKGCGLHLAEFDTHGLSFGGDCLPLGDPLIEHGVVDGARLMLVSAPFGQAAALFDIVTHATTELEDALVVDIAEVESKINSKS